MPDEDDSQNPLADDPSFQRIRSLGGRASGLVLLAQDKKTSEQVVVKLYPRGGSFTEDLERHILEHRTLAHPYLNRVKRVFLTPRHLGLAMEYAAGRVSLYEYLRSRRQLPEDLARRIFQQLIVAVDYCHRLGVESTDVRLRSVLLGVASPWPLVSLAAFGHSSRVMRRASEGGRFYSSVPYLPREVILARRKGSYDIHKAEIWSCGVVLYAMMVGRYPFHRPESEADLREVIECIRCARYTIPEGVMSSECEDMIRRLLVANPKERASMAEIQKNDWFRKWLPHGALELNDGLSTQSDVQLDKRIRSLLLKAQIPYESGGGEEEKDEDLDFSVFD